MVEARVASTSPFQTKFVTRMHIVFRASASDLASVAEM